MRYLTCILYYTSWISPPGFEENLHIGVFKNWAKNSIEKAVFQKANCESCFRRMHIL